MQPNALSRSGVRLDLGPVNNQFDEETQQRIQAARAAGVPEAQIQQEALQYQSKKTAMQPKPQPSGLDEWLPTIGGVVGGIGGGVIGGPVGAVAGAAAGSGLGETVRQNRQGEELSLPKIAAQTALGGVGEGVGGLVFKGVGKLLSGAGKGLATNALNFTPGMKASYKAAHKEALEQTLSKLGLEGADNALIQAKGIAPHQALFNSIAKSDIPIDQDVFLSNSIEVIEKLKSSSVPSIKASAKGVDEALGNIYDKISRGEIKTMADLNAEKIAFDMATSESQFASDIWGVNRTTGDIVRRSIQEMADGAGLKGPNGESLKEIGMTLNKLRDISETAGKREGVGAGSPFSLTNLVFGGLGGAVGGIPGAAAATAGRTAATIPAIARPLSKALTGAGRGLTSKVGLGTGGSVGAGTLPAIGSVGGQQSFDTPTDGSANTDSIEEFSNTHNTASIPQEAEYLTGYSPRDLYTAKMAAERAGNKAAASQLDEWYKDEVAYQKANGTGGGKQIPAAQVTELADIQDSVNMMNGLGAVIEQYKDVLGPTQGLLKGANPYDTKAQDFQSQMVTVAQVVGKALEGGVLRQEDTKKYLKILPQITDTPAVAKAKIKNVKQLLNNKLKTRQQFFQGSGFNSAGGVMPPIGESAQYAQ